jgi:hypothetical protein
MRKYAAIVLVAASFVAAVHTQRAAPANLSALDYFEIQQLYARFCHGLDSAADNGYLFANVFTADGVYVDAAGQRYEGREKLAEFARLNPDGRKGPTNVTHYTVNVMIDSAPGGATGRGYLMVAAPPVARGAQAATGGAQAGPGAGRANNTNIVIDGGQYSDDLVKTADGWRIKKRTFTRPTGRN